MLYHNSTYFTLSLFYLSSSQKGHIFASVHLTLYALNSISSIRKKPSKYQHLGNSKYLGNKLEDEIAKL